MTIIKDKSKVPSTRILGIENKNTNSNLSDLYDWVGTTAEFQAGGTKSFYNYVSPNYSLRWNYANIPLGVMCKAICYGNGKFVSVSLNNSFATYSTDGINWSKVNLPSSGNWNSIAYGDELFLAVKKEVTNTYAYSEDGITWSSGTFPNNYATNKVTYGNGKFLVLTTSNNKYVYTSNGTSWTEGTLALGGEWIDCCYGNGKFIAVGASTRDIIYSTDLNTWTQVTVPAGSWSCITYGNGKFIMASKDSNNYLYSTNGTEWTAATLPISAKWTDITYGNNKFVLIANASNKFLTSLDGTNWDISVLPGTNNWGEVAYGTNTFVVTDTANSKALYSIIDSLQCFVDTNPVTLDSQVYSDLVTQSELTITSINNRNITLSDGNTYARNSEGDSLNRTCSVGELNPEWVCYITDDTTIEGDSRIGSDLSYVNNQLQLKDQEGNLMGNPVTITGGSGGAAHDNVTIILNESNELQTVASIEQNHGAVKYDWIGTLAEYQTQDIETLHPEWMCYITDDSTPGTEGNLSSLTDVRLNTPVDKNILTYDTSLSKWTNKTLNQAAGFTVANDSSVVKLTGDQTISGSKIFNNAARFRNNLTPSTSTTKESVIEDVIVDVSRNTDGKNDGANIVRFQNTDGSREVRYRAGFRKSDDSGNVWPAVACGIDTNDKSYVRLPADYTSAPIPTEDTTTSSQIDTVGARNTKLTNYRTSANQDVIDATKAVDADVVHKDGSETITGTKTFTPSVPVKFKSTIIDATVTPTANQYQYTDYLDKNNVRLGVIGSTKQADGKYGVYLQAGNAGNLGILTDGTTATTFASKPTATSSVSNAQIATTGWVNDSSYSTNVVHRSGDETIAGNKTFNNAIRSNSAVSLQSTTSTTTHAKPTTAPAENTIVGRINFMNSDSTYSTGHIQTYRSTNNAIVTAICARQAIDGAEKAGELGICMDASGNSYTFAPTPSASSNTTNIATTAWCRTTGNGLVHTSGDETIAGAKKFTGYVWTESSSASDTKTNFYQCHNKRFAIDDTSASAKIDTQLVFYDKNDDWVGFVEHALNTNGSSEMAVNIRKKDKSTSTALKIGFDNSGNIYTYAPTPATTDNSTKIATTAYVKAQNIIKTTYTSGTSGYRIWSDGYCEQWGYVASGGTQAITLVKTYKDTSYNVLVSGSRTQSSSQSTEVVINSSSQITIYGYSSNTGAFWKTSGYLASGQY